MARLEEAVRVLRQCGGSAGLEDVLRTVTLARAWLQEGAAAEAAAEPLLVSVVQEWVRCDGHPPEHPPHHFDAALRILARLGLATIEQVVATHGSNRAGDLLAEQTKETGEADLTSTG